MDDLIAAIVDVRDKLRRGVFSNEDQVSKGVVMRLLQQLGWDVYDPTQVSSEFRIGNRKVDYALRHGPFGSAVLIEVKNVGKATPAGEDQLFDYCFREGVPLAVLADGRVWNFYWPAGRGSYEQRRFAVVDLVEQKPPASASRLRRYLAFDVVASGHFEENARSDYTANQNQILARQQFPLAVEAVIAKADPRVVAVFCDEVERRCGIRPDEGDVRNYLGTSFNRTVVSEGMPGRPTSAPEPSPVATKRTRRVQGPQPSRAARGPAQATPAPGFTLFGSSVSCRNDAAVLVGLVRALGERDSGLYERLAPRLAGRTRRFLSQDRNEIYPAGSSEGVLRSVAKLPGGWWLGTNSSTHVKNEQLKTVRHVAGLSPNEVSGQLRGRT